jgi:sugar lactone lactonase YvrE
VFDLPVNGPDPSRRFGPLAHSKAVDMTALPNGDIVVLLQRGSPALVQVDQQARGHELPLPDDVDPASGNSVVAAADGALLFSDRGRVLRRELDGRVVTVAGGPRPRSASGDGGPAVGAGMTPAGLAVLPDGSLLIADEGNHRIRRVDPTGQISTIAGTGRPGDDGDGGPATAARLGYPTHLAAYPDGSYLIVHGLNYLRVRRVDPTGRITTVVGVGRAGTSQPCRSAGGPTTSLRIYSEKFTGGIAALPDGGFLIAAEELGGYYRPKPGGLMRVSADGVITPMLCAGSEFWSPDGRYVYPLGRAVTDVVDEFPPADLAVTADGSIVLGYHHRSSTSLRMLAAPGRAQRLAVAAAPGTFTSVIGGPVMITATDAATVRVSVYRKRRLLLETAVHVRPGENLVRLPRHRQGGVYDLRVRATTADGRTAAARLRLLGPRITIAYAKRRLKREFADHSAGEGVGGLRLSDCIRHGPRRVRCRASFYVDYDITVHQLHSIVLRRDGVLHFRAYWPEARQWRGDTSWAYAITP